MANIKKLYLAYKAGYLGDNILDTYFSFLANMILDEHLMVVEDSVVATMFKNRYSIDLPLPFLRQILGEGINKSCLINDRGKYNVVVEELDKYRFSETNFHNLWNKLIDTFTSYCKEKDLVEISSGNVEEFVLNSLDGTDDKILSGEKIEEKDGMSSAEYAWYNFIIEQSKSCTDLYSFISALSASNITKQALFYIGETEPNYSGLNIYLDSPIIFALLGMDEKSRTESYKTLINDMRKAKCSLHVLDHNFQEVDSIISRAAVWATSNQYDLRKANNAARFFHDSQMSNTEISEFCDNIETKLNDFGITVKETNYDIFQNQFQENEKELLDMVKNRYNERGYELTQERQNSIHIDVRSIVMIYRERQGQTATKLQNAKHILLTSNNVIANVSKQYESNRSIRCGHIPACISADLFGAILWLNTPLQMLEYQKQKLLADCYAFLKPDKTLLGKYVQSLDEAKNADEIDEKKYLFLRSHKVVLDSLMDITHGDYARFDSNTYREVYDDIQAKALKQYKEEATAHNQTREKLKNLEEMSVYEKQQSTNEINRLNEELAMQIAQNKKREEEEFNKKLAVWGWLATIFIAGIPFLFLTVIIEMGKIHFAYFSWHSLIGITGLCIATIVDSILFKIGKKWCFEQVRTYLEKHKNKKTTLSQIK